MHCNVLISNFSNKILLENAISSMDVDFKDFYSKALNQSAWDNQDTQNWTLDFQWPMKVK